MSYKLITVTDIDAAYKDGAGAPGADLAGIAEIVADIVNAHVPAFLRRDLDYGSSTVYLPSDGTHLIWLQKTPIDTAQTLTVNYDTALPPTYSSDTLLTVDEDYFVDAEAGKISLAYSRPRTDSKVFKIVYTGGVVTADGADVPPLVQRAAQLYAKYLVDNWNSVGYASQSFNGAAVSYPQARMWMPIEVQRLLIPETRRIFI